MIIQGDSTVELKKLEDNSVDSIVTDPPYGLSFMGKKWDYDVPSVEIWVECIRVLKPGGYLLAFAGTRTQHRMAVNIEDAGFEIRDMIAWVYGSGFPKSHNISKAIEKKNGVLEETTSTLFNNPGGKRDLSKRSDYGYKFEPKGDEAKQWEGWGTALKPALEPITVARKPLSEKTVAENVLKYGTGGINIDESRVGTEEIKINGGKVFPEGGGCKWKEINETRQGRFPANFIHSGEDEVVGLFPDTKASTKSGYNFEQSNNDNTAHVINNIKSGIHFGDSGSAARFFYCAKASKSDRNDGLDDFEEKQYSHDGRNKTIENAYQRNKSISANNHPTVKPTKLMQYLVRLVTPKGGTVLDPFMGSGSTGKACVYEGFDFIGIDLDEEYCRIARARIDHAKKESIQQALL